MSHQKMDQLVGFLLHPTLSKNAKKLGIMLKYTPHFQTAFGTAAYQKAIFVCFLNSILKLLNNVLTPYSMLYSLIDIKLSKYALKFC